MTSTNEARDGHLTLDQAFAIQKIAKAAGAEATVETYQYVRDEGDVGQDYRVSIVSCDAQHGNIVVREIGTATDEAGVQAILADMAGERKQRAKGTRRRIAAEREMDRE